MNKNNKVLSHKFFSIISGIFLVASLIVFIAIGFYAQYQDIKDTYTLAHETTEFLQTQCEKFDNYNRGISSRSLQSLLDDAKGLREFIDRKSLDNSDFLNDFIRTEHIGGIIVTDNKLNLVSQANMDNKNLYDLWKKVLEKKYIKNLIKYPKKSFIGNVMLKKIPYDYAVISTNDGKRLILCYSSAVKPVTDPYEFSINNILKNNNFRKNPTVMITDGKQLISTNYKGDKKASKKFFDKINAATKWNDKSFTVFEFDGKTWYGTKMVNDSYYIYALYPSASVFTNRKNYIAYGFMLYLIICLILLSIQRHFDKANLKKMQKQLGIINAISTHYSSIMLLHLDDMKLENINTSPFMNKLIDEEKTPRNIFSCICHKYVAPKYRQLLLDFMDFDTIAERLVDNSYLEIEVKDLTGIWYSVIIIPQKSDVNGNVSAVLIATRDVSYVKQAEELSYKDKLTGLHNRNYMESRSREFLNPDNYPVSLIMADCNYLKRTNDNLGHEYGDMLLKRIAGVIREKLPKNCLAMRVGGDEFLIVGMNCPADEVAQIISDIRRGLVEKSDDKLTLSVSFGSYTIENENISFKEAYEQADQAMYRDKQASRIRRG